MHITLEADYAVRIVLFLAQAGKRSDASTISDATGVSLRFALKILRNLVANKIVKSFKGTQGGYELNVAPKEITLRAVLEAIEGEYKFSRCVNSTTACTKPAKGSCEVQKVYAEITQNVKESLERVTIDMLY